MKNIIITGANGNLGSAVTNHFLERGYRVIATVVSESMLEDFAAHKHLDVQVVNLTNEEATAAFIQFSIDKYKKIDAALMLVGGFAMGSIADTNIADIHKQFSLNFETAYFISRPLFSHMLSKGKGRLVYIGARPALEPEQGKKLFAYGLTKSLLFKLAEFLNAAAKGKNVTATVVVPSTLDTPLNRKNMPDVDPADWVSPDALAEILEFVVSEKSAPIRESVIKVYSNT